MPTAALINKTPTFPGRTLRSLVLSCLAVLFMVAGCSDEQGDDYYQGYVEAEYVFVSSPLGGILESLQVARGMKVEAGMPLFRLDDTVEAAVVAEAEQDLQRAENRLADLAKGLRPEELAIIKARLDQARIGYDLAVTEYARRQKLFADKVIPKDELDRTRADMERGAALVEQLEAELTAAGLGGRPDVQAAARAEREAAGDRLTRVRWRLAQQSQDAPASGLVFDTYYLPGEFVPASHPVVSILPPERITVRFFVPEPVLAIFAPGQEVTVRIDGSDRDYRATVSYISPQAEYTPPVIYSRHSRTKLVYMIEARLSQEDAVELKPGQPVDVLPGPDRG